MAWVQRAYSKGEIDRAGGALVHLPKDDPAREHAIAVVDNWRMSHAYPLQVIKMTLKRRALKLDKKALIAQRLKRRLPGKPSLASLLLLDRLRINARQLLSVSTSPIWNSSRSLAGEKS
jgi:hypothetical protein